MHHGTPLLLGPRIQRRPKWRRDTAGPPLPPLPVETRHLAVTKTGGGDGVVTGGGDIQLGDTAHLIATANTGSSFVGWTGAGIVTGSGTRDVLMDTDKAVDAKFTCNVDAHVTRFGVQEYQGFKSWVSPITDMPAGICRIRGDLGTAGINQAGTRTDKFNSAGYGSFPFIPTEVASDAAWTNATTGLPAMVARLRPETEWFEIGNEPQEGYPWTTYFRRLRLAFPIVNNAGGKVIVCWKGGTSPQSTETNFLNQLTPTDWTKVWGVAVHTYDLYPSSILGALQNIRAQVPAGKPLLLTETGWNTQGSKGFIVDPAGSNPGIPAGHVSEAQQRDKIIEVHDLLLAHAAALDLRYIGIFIYKDWTSLKGDAFAYCGAVKLDGTRKLAYNAIKSLSRAVAY